MSAPAEWMISGENTVKYWIDIEDIKVQGLKYAQPILSKVFKIADLNFQISVGTSENGKNVAVHLHNMNDWRVRVFVKFSVRDHEKRITKYFFKKDSNNSSRGFEDFIPFNKCKNLLDPNGLFTLQAEVELLETEVVACTTSQHDKRLDKMSEGINKIKTSVDWMENLVEEQRISTRETQKETLEMSLAVGEMRTEMRRTFCKTEKEINSLRVGLAGSFHEHKNVLKLLESDITENISETQNGIKAITERFDLIQHQVESMKKQTEESLVNTQNELKSFKIDIAECLSQTQIDLKLFLCSEMEKFQNQFFNKFSIPTEMEKLENLMINKLSIPTTANHLNQLECPNCSETVKPPMRLKQCTQVNGGSYCFCLAYPIFTQTFCSLFKTAIFQGHIICDDCHSKRLETEVGRTRRKQSPLLCSQPTCDQKLSGRPASLEQLLNLI